MTTANGTMTVVEKTDSGREVRMAQNCVGLGSLA
jgi:hypothetical protein